MPNKTEEYLALACKTADSFSRQWEHWTEFLITAARLYKYSYPDQLMIYAQRPDATACAEYDVWNNKMNRYVRRGSKGIALLDESGGYPRLHYVFDVSDTAPRRNALYPDLWQINDSLKEPVRSMLAENYGVHSESFGQQLADVAGKLVQSYWDNNSSDILGIVDGSYLMSYDDAGRELQFKSAAAMGVTYMLLERCGLDPAGWFDEKDFQAVYDFTTPTAVYALGTAVSDCSREVLRQIERTVKTTIRRRNAERSQHEYEQQSELHADRGLSSPEPDPASAEDPAGQVRQAAPDVPEGASPGAVQHDAPEREPVPAPDGGGADGRKPDAADHGAASETEPGPGQGAESDGMGAAHEQPAGTGRGTGADGADLQLSFLDAHIPTEAQQIEKIDQAESEKSPSAFVLSQTDIEKALRRGSNFENSKLRIWEIYQTQPDRKLRAKALAKEYKFMKFIETMDMSFSYKPVLLKAIYEYMDSNGRVALPDVVDYFIDFYEDRKAHGMIAEKPNSIYQKGGYTKKDVEKNILSNPFKRFEDMRFLMRCKDVETVEVNPIIFRKLTREDWLHIVDVCDKSLEKYYMRFKK